MAGPRPGGVTVLAVLEFLGGIIGLGAGAYYLNDVNNIAASLGYTISDVPDFLAFYGIELAVGILALLVGYGLWKGIGWGWTLGVLLSAVNVIYAFGFGAYFVATYGDYTELSSSLASLVVALIVIYYLTRPHVKAFFGKGPAAFAAPPPPPV